VDRLNAARVPSARRPRADAVDRHDRDENEIPGRDQSRGQPSAAGRHRHHIGQFLRGLRRKTLELLRELMPGLTRVAAFVETGSPSSEFGWDELQPSGEALGLTIPPHVAAQVTAGCNGSADPADTRRRPRRAPAACCRAGVRFCRL
jgi:hypothetical protein